MNPIFNEVNDRAASFWGSQGPLGKRWVIGFLAFVAGWSCHWIFSHLN